MGEVKCRKYTSVRQHGYQWLKFHLNELRAAARANNTALDDMECTISNHDELRAQLEAEIAKLKAENGELKAENGELRAQRAKRTRRRAIVYTCEQRHELANLHYTSNTGFTSSYDGMKVHECGEGTWCVWLYNWEDYKSFTFEVMPCLGDAKKLPAVLVDPSTLSLARHA